MNLNGNHDEDIPHWAPAAVQPQQWPSLLLRGFTALLAIGLFWLALSGILYMAADVDDPFRDLEADARGVTVLPAEAAREAADSWPVTVAPQEVTSQPALISPAGASALENQEEPEEIELTDQVLLSKLRSQAVDRVLKGGLGAVLIRILSLSDTSGLEKCQEGACHLFVAVTVDDATQRTKVANGTSSFDWNAVPFFFSLPTSFLTSDAKVTIEVMSTSSDTEVRVGVANFAIDSMGTQVETPLELPTDPGLLKLQFAYAYLTLGGVAPTTPAPDPDPIATKQGNQKTTKTKKTPPANYTLLGTWRARYDEKGDPIAVQGSLAKKRGCGQRGGRSICVQNFTNHSEPRLDPIDPNYELWSGDDPVDSSAVIKSSFMPRKEKKGHNRPRSTAGSDPECTALCHNKVKNMGCWLMSYTAMGRLGNRLSEMMHAIYEANMTGIVPGLEMEPGFISVVWDFPQYLCVGRPQDFNFTPRVVKDCLKYANRLHEYDSACRKAMASQYVELSRQYLVPYFTPSMKACLEAPRGFDEAELLTIHLRGEDIFGVHVDAHEYEKEPYWNHAAAQRMTEQPPCPFYKKLINDGTFTRVLIITSQDLANPCVEWLNMHRKNLTNSKGELVKMELQTGSLEQDCCAILKAQQIAPSHSSMLHNLIVVAAALHPVSVYFSRRAFDPHWLLGCSATATNVTFHLYAGTHTKRGPTNPISGLPVPHTLKAALDWLVNFPEGSLRALTPEEQNC